LHFWRIDKTYIKVAGIYRYVYRAVNRNNFWNKNIKIRRCKYLNNCVEQDHRNIKRRIAIDTGFKEFESAQRTLAGIEVVSIIRKNQIVDSKKSYFKTFLSLVA
jgi:putative transposase